MLNRILGRGTEERPSAESGVHIPKFGSSTTKNECWIKKYMQANQEVDGLELKIKGGRGTAEQIGQWEKDLPLWTYIRDLADQMKKIYKTTEIPEVVMPAHPDVLKLEENFKVKLEDFNEFDDIRNLTPETLKAKSTIQPVLPIIGASGAGVPELNLEGMKNRTNK